jgi:hypothetical protein
MLHEATAAHLTTSREARQGHLDIATDIATSPQMGEYRALLAVDKQMAALGKFNDAIRQAPDLASTQKLVSDPREAAVFKQRGVWGNVGAFKLALLDAIRQQRNNLAKQFVTETDRRRAKAGNP